MRDVDGWISATRTDGRGKEAARGLLKVHALARPLPTAAALVADLRPRLARKGFDAPVSVDSIFLVQALLEALERSEDKSAPLPGELRTAPCFF